MNSIVPHVVRYALPVVSVVLSVFAIVSVVDMRLEINVQHRAIATLQEIEMARQNATLKEILRNAQADSQSIKDDLYSLRRRP